MYPLPNPESMTHQEKLDFARAMLNNVTMQAVLAIQRTERRQENRTPLILDVSQAKNTTPQPTNEGA